jgi:D-arabinose 5-phosphate isomerase GutQ
MAYENFLKNVEIKKLKLKEGLFKSSLSKRVSTDLIVTDYPNSEIAFVSANYLSILKTKNYNQDDDNVYPTAAFQYEQLLLLSFSDQNLRLIDLKTYLVKGSHKLNNETMNHICMTPDAKYIIGCTD